MAGSIRAKPPPTLSSTQCCRVYGLFPLFRQRLADLISGDPVHLGQRRHNLGRTPIPELKVVVDKSFGKALRVDIVFLLKRSDPTVRLVACAPVVELLAHLLWRALGPRAPVSYLRGDV